MSWRVSNTKTEAQGRADSAVTEEQKQLMQAPDSRSYTEAYQAILARELYMHDFQEDYCKTF